VRTALFSAAFGELEAMREFAAAAAAAAGLGVREIAAVRLAVDEACANIIEHAYRGVSGGRIEISCDAQPGRLTLLLRDQGRAFDLAAVRAPAMSANPDEREVGGLGVFLIRKLMDDVRLERSAQGDNLLTLVKRASGFLTNPEPERKIPTS
jgi:serine/threonine-protein kinase RsbW